MPPAKTLSAVGENVTLKEQEAAGVKLVEQVLPVMEYPAGGVIFKLVAATLPLLLTLWTSETADCPT